MSQIFATPKTSRSSSSNGSASRSPSSMDCGCAATGAASSPLASLPPASCNAFPPNSSMAFFSPSPSLALASRRAALALALASFQSNWICRQRCTCACHANKCCWNASDGVGSSTRVTTFLCNIHSLSLSAHLTFRSHSKRMSSKPSSFAGMLKWVKLVPKTAGVMSGMACFLNHTFFSSSESSTVGGCGSGGSSSILSSSFSSSLSFSSSSSAFGGNCASSSFFSASAASAAAFPAAASCSRFCLFAALSACFRSRSNSRCLLASNLRCLSASNSF
mmetsp:Transcript_54378/g.157220  ORF Transcript_54378/g.157220 Transcript_54378/m.157220 type:complete len:277 (+) Transcript_54378:751-1581(+)